MPSSTWRRALSYALLATAAAVTAMLALWPRVRPVPSPPLVIGFEDDPPYHYAGPDGHPRGMAVEMVSEAARRAGVRLTWRYYPGSSADAVRGNEVDLWPQMAVLESRRSFAHFTDPWLTTDTYLFIRGATSEPERSLRGEVGVNAQPITAVRLRELFPLATPRQYEDNEHVVSALCRGELTAAMMSLSVATRALAPSGPCGTGIRAFKVGPAVQLAIGSTPRWGWVADRIRSQMDGMARDGSLASIAMPYSPTAAVEVTYAIQIAETRQRERLLTRSVFILGVAFVAVLVLALALRRSNRRRLAAVAAQHQMEAQLRQSQHLEAVGRLAGGIAHDFNNVMTIILGHSQLSAAELSPGDPVRASLEEIQKAASLATGLVRQLLAFGRRQSVQPADVSIREVVEDTKLMIERLLSEQIVLSLEYGAGPDIVRADLGQLQQVLLNLAANARDAMPHGGRLSIITSIVARDAGPDASAGTYVRIRIQDEGIGMDADTARRVFEPFFTTKPFGSGAGLGLAIVYGIVTQAGGAIEVWSEPGRGTRFDLFFPAIAASA
jgi:signal transduction histidine kinase